MRIVGGRGVRRVRGRTMSAWQAFGLVVLTLALAALFNAPALLHDSESKPFGGNRDFWMRIWRPADNVSDALLLDRPRRVLDTITGHGSARDGGVALAIAPSPTASVGVTLMATPAPVPTPTPRPHMRAPSAHAPLQIYVAGDSLAERLGDSVARAASDTGVMETDIDARISTGLARPDVFDWPARLGQVSAKDKPDVMVLMFGGNDAQGVLTPAGEVYQPGSDGWRAEYRRRVILAMDAASAPGRLVFWVGMPAMRDAGFEVNISQIEQIGRDVASSRDDVIYIDAHRILSDASGKYTPYLAADDGTQELVREPDGIHVTRAGGDRLAAQIMSWIQAEIAVSSFTASTP